MIKNLILFISLLISYNSIGQTVSSLSDCETIFLKNNLSLLAAQFNIDGAKALTIQAKLWDNPYLSTEFNARNPENGKYFDIGQSGQKAASIQQLIYMGGKKKAQIELAKTNQVIAALELQDLLRNLKFELKRSFYNLYFNHQQLEISNQQINNLDTLVKSYGIQSAKGNVPIKDYVRLQSLLLGLKNDRMEIIKSNIEEESKLNILLADSIQVKPVLKESFFNKYMSQLHFNIFDLEQQALLLRPDFAVALQNVKSNEININLQKAMRVPDITLGSSWDQHGGAFDNQINLTLGLPLPLWNKNQGNIKFAESMTSLAKTDKQSEELKLKAEVASTYKKWFDANNNLKQLLESNIETYESVYQGVMYNFKKGNIGILDFTDFLESYNQMRAHFNELKKTVVLSSETLNNVVNKELF
jgi:cobalt-zinc-cadmium efflux system outer membrane protein